MGRESLVWIMSTRKHDNARRTIHSDSLRGDMSMFVYRLESELTVIAAHGAFATSVRR